jgi:ribosomal 50S subunit-associated protein YjgA (DUF615 family)
MANYPDLKFPNDAAHMLFDIGYTYALLARTRDLLELALYSQNSQPKRLIAEMQSLLEEIEALEQGRLQAIGALYENVDSALELLAKIVRSN